jgi:NitT/TauT family transport system ATP-binding protein
MPRGANVVRLGESGVGMQASRLVPAGKPNDAAGQRRAAGRRAVLLSLRDVNKYYASAGEAPTTALDTVCLDVYQGELVAIVGPSGGGKSTLLQIAAGLIPPSRGQVLLDGRPIIGPPPEVVYLFQQYSKSLFPWRTVTHNVAFALEQSNLRRREVMDRARSYLKRVALEDFGNHYPWQLSGGMQQRVAIARALAAEPRALLMDEPFSAVDALTRLELQTLLLDIWHSNEDLTIVLVTHDVDEAVYLADRIAVLTRNSRQVLQIFENSLPRPRHPIETRESQSFLSLRHTLLSILLRRSDGRS